jgi:hypothetical protein
MIQHNILISACCMRHTPSSSQPFYTITLACKVIRPSWNDVFHYKGLLFNFLDLVTSKFKLSTLLSNTYVVSSFISLKRSNNVTLALTLKALLFAHIEQSFVSHCCQDKQLLFSTITTNQNSIIQLVS